MIYNSTVDMCKLLAGSVESIVMRVVAHDFFKYVKNIPEKCPFPKGNYTIDNFTISDKYVPDAALNMITRSSHIKIVFLFYFKYGRRLPQVKAGELIVLGKFTKLTRSTIV